MKRKYYMRGLGVGILATSMLFLIAMTVMGYPMNDDDIRRKAAALGMVEASDTSKTLADAQKEKDGHREPPKSFPQSRSTTWNARGYGGFLPLQSVP